MKIGDKVEFEKDDFIYEGTVVAVRKDNTKIKVSVLGLGDTVELDNE